MLTIETGKASRDCSGVSRRSFLRAGALTLGGLTLPELLATRADAATGSFLRDKSVVLLFLQGGPSHIELFDPKMTAPADIRSTTGEIATTLPGVTFGGTFPELAKLAHKFTIVRSYGSKNGGHTYEDVLSARNPLKATMSAIYARLAGTNHPTTGVPRNTLVLPEAVVEKLKIGSSFETGALPTLTQAGRLGPNYVAFSPSGSGTLQQDMRLRMSAERLDDRRALLGQLDAVRRFADHTGAVDGLNRYQQQAFDVLTGGVAAAFDLREEDPATIARYDTSHLFTNAEVQRWYDMARSTNLLGKQMLLARRLCEYGCGFVTVSDCGWDMHSNGNSPKRLAGMNWLGPQTDHAVAAFIADVEARGLSDKILLIVTGEMGRTPRINNDGGRDHYGELTPLLFYGGGLKMGQVIGQSDSKASRPVGDGYDPRHLMSTVMHTLFDIGVMRLDQGVPREVAGALEKDAPIAGLL